MLAEPVAPEKTAEALSALSDVQEQPAEKTATGATLTVGTWENTNENDGKHDATDTGNPTNL